MTAQRGAGSGCQSWVGGDDSGSWGKSWEAGGIRDWSLALTGVFGGKYETSCRTAGQSSDQTGNVRNDIGGSESYLPRMGKGCSRLLLSCAGCSHRTGCKEESPHHFQAGEERNDKVWIEDLSDFAETNCRRCCFEEKVEDQRRSKGGGEISEGRSRVEEWMNDRRCREKRYEDFRGRGEAVRQSAGCHPAAGRGDGWAANRKTTADKGHKGKQKETVKGKDVWKTQRRTKAVTEMHPKHKVKKPGGGPE